MHEEVIAQVQKILKSQGVDGWLIYDFQKRNTTAMQFLGFDEKAHLTRRFFYWIPAIGEPVKLVNKIEPNHLDLWPGHRKEYFSYQSLTEQLEKILQDVRRIAMEYSPKGNIPYVSLVDGGTLELIRSLGKDIVSSSGFVQYLTCVLSEKQRDSHLRAALFLEKTVDKAWDFISQKMKSDGKTSEYEVQQFIKDQFNTHGFISDGEPICAVNANSSNPHYSPTKETSKEIIRGDYVLIDIWAKEDRPQSVFADICKVAVIRSSASSKEQEIFSIVRNAQKKTAEYITKAFKNHEIVKGYQADAIARNIIEDSGYGKYFTHRTGHNIHTSNHGPGTHLDGLETYDDRPLIKGTCFSIEPGIYLPDEFGVRLEFDMYIDNQGGCFINGGEQDFIKTLG